MILKNFMVFVLLTILSSSAVWAGNKKEWNSEADKIVDYGVLFEYVQQNPKQGERVFFVEVRFNTRNSDVYRKFHEVKGQPAHLKLQKNKIIINSDNGLLCKTFNEDKIICVFSLSEKDHCSNEGSDNLCIKEDLGMKKHFGTVTFVFNEELFGNKNNIESSRYSFPLELSQMKDKKYGLRNYGLPTAYIKDRLKGQSNVVWKISDYELFYERRTYLSTLTESVSKRIRKEAGIPGNKSTSISLLDAYENVSSGNVLTDTFEHLNLEEEFWLAKNTSALYYNDSNVEISEKVAYTISYTKKKYGYINNKKKREFTEKLKKARTLYLSFKNTADQKNYKSIIGYSTSRNEYPGNNKLFLREDPVNITYTFAYVFEADNVDQSNVAGRHVEVGFNTMYSKTIKKYGLDFSSKIFYTGEDLEPAKPGETKLIKNLTLKIKYNEGKEIEFLWWKKKMVPYMKYGQGKDGITYKFTKDFMVGIDLK